MTTMARKTFATIAAALLLAAGAHKATACTGITAETSTNKTKIFILIRSVIRAEIYSEVRTGRLNRGLHIVIQDNY